MKTKFLVLCLIVFSVGILGLYYRMFFVQNQFIDNSKSIIEKSSTPMTTNSPIKSSDATQQSSAIKPNIEIKQNNADTSVTTKIECQEVGNKIYQNLVTRLGKFLVFNPEYTYNKKLNTCLYAGGFFGDNTAAYMEFFVIDSLTNKQILTYAAQKNQSGEFVKINYYSNTNSIPDFNKQKETLFAE